MKKVVYFITEQLVYVASGEIEYKENLHFTGDVWLNTIAQTGKLVDTSRSINRVIGNVEITLPRNTISITRFED